MGARAGDTHHTAGTGKFWHIWFLVEGAYLIAMIVNIFEELILGVSLDFGWILMGAVIAAVMTSKRQELRQRLGGKRQDCCLDCLLYWCCFSCVTCQEAKQVDSIQGVQIRCCCQMMELPVTTVAVQQATSQVIGQPVTQEWQQPVGQPIVVATPITPAGLASNQVVVQGAVAQPKV